jgi:O-acetylhomoserine/O-acetylserine sulfhydrylase-like pyridoxal-dependent enzyme
MAMASCSQARSLSPIPGQNRVFVAGLAGTTLDNGVPVVVDTSTGQLGVLPSSQRFKTDIKPMNKTSEGILALRPVTFCYQNSSTGTAQFGLIAEEVAKVDPHLVVRDSDGQPYTVRYDAVNAMLLNEFLKEHKKVESQQTTIRRLKSNAAKEEATITELKKGMGALTAQLKEQATEIQKVSAKVEMSRPALRVVTNR